jgi:hypothetical protein
LNLLTFEVGHSLFRHKYMPHYIPYAHSSSHSP